MRHYQLFCKSYSMEENILKDSLNDSLLWRIAVRCSPSNRGPGAILSQPHALANLDDRLLEAMAPKEHDLELSAFDLMLAAQYEEVKLHLNPLRHHTYTPETHVLSSTFTPGLQHAPPLRPIQHPSTQNPTLQTPLHLPTYGLVQNALAKPRPVRTLPRLQDVSLSRNPRCVRDEAMLADDAAFVPVFGFETRGAGGGDAEEGGDGVDGFAK